MRVLQVAGLAGPNASGGGVWAVAAMQADALRAAGHDVTLFGGWLGDDPPSSDHTRLFTVRPPFPGAGLRGLMSRRMVCDVIEAARTADLVHLHFCRDYTTTSILLRLGRTDLPIVVQTHGMYGPARSRSTRAFDAVLERRLDAAPRRWLSLTELETSELVAKGIDSDRIDRVINAVPAGERWMPPASTRFSFIARLHERKQPAVFVGAANELLREGINASFTIAGPDEGEADRVRSLIASSFRPDAFEMVGALSPADARALQHSSTAVVLPSRDEPYPMLALETAASGVPLILTSQSGVSRLFADADAAEVVEPTIKQVTAAMRRLATEPSRGAQVGIRARALWERTWTTDRLLRQLATSYVLASRSD